MVGSAAAGADALSRGRTEKETLTHEGAGMDAAQLRKAVEGIKWFHTIDLGQGVVTPGFDRSPEKLERICLPADMSGRSVLDVGAWDGFFSFECERRGATRVLATDHFAWHAQASGGKAGFELARRVLGARVEDRDIDVMDLAPERVGAFDIVLLLGVLYHLKNPVEAVRRVASVCRQLLVLETEVDLLWFPRPAVAFHLSHRLRGDDTNACAPNVSWLIEMLQNEGFRTVRVVNRYSLVKRVARAASWKWRFGEPLLGGIQRGRVTVHAER
jgi:tRNA (mo5U34)-methyltransferase